jgi:glycosyltransferase involved in cell wall biosynthesis
MKMMILNNNVLFESGQGLYVPKETGKFYIDLLNEGNQVTIFQIRMQKGLSDTFADFDVTGEGLNIISVERRSNRIWAYVKAFFVGVNEIRKSDFVYIFHPGPICTVFAFMCFALNKRFGLYVRGEQGISTFWSKFLYRKAEVVFTVSPKFTEIIQTYGGSSFTIRPMIDVLERDLVLNRLYSAKSSYVLLYVGRTVRDKGMFELIEAVKQLRDAGHLNFKVQIVGDGIDLQDMLDQVDAYNLKDVFEFYGMVSDKDTLVKFYQNADLFILPTHHEGFPRVLYEAMILGIPILTTFVGTISYLMRDHVNCYEIKPKDVDSIRNEVEGFLISYEEKAKVARVATQDIMEYLSDKKDKHGVQLSRYINSY